MKLRRILLALATIAGTLAMTACGDDAAGTVWTVSPGEYIQTVVDQARPGDVITIEPGIYNESVVITTPDLVIQGVDRSTTILDGNGLSSGLVINADRTVVQNLTFREYAANGIYISGITADRPNGISHGFVVRNVSYLDNGVYGILTFAAEDGVIVDNYSAGHYDSGYYIGQCKPCDVLIDRSVSQYNGMGYEGTSASNVYLTNSVWIDNRLGIRPNSQNIKNLNPQTGAVIAGNIVARNQDDRAPEQIAGLMGIGVALGGGEENEVYRNWISLNDGAGVYVTSLDGYNPADNKVHDNFVQGNGVDLVYWATDDERTSSRGNCFYDNDFGASSPADVSVMTCGAEVMVDAPRVKLPPSVVQTERDRDTRLNSAANAPMLAPGLHYERLHAELFVVPTLETVTMPTEAEIVEALR